jgi:hypothetical protein
MHLFQSRCSTKAKQTRSKESWKAVLEHRLCRAASLVVSIKRAVISILTPKPLFVRVSLSHSESSTDTMKLLIGAEGVE